METMLQSRILAGEYVLRGTATLGDQHIQRRRALQARAPGVVKNRQRSAPVNLPFPFGDIQWDGGARAAKLVGNGQGFGQFLEERFKPTDERQGCPVNLQLLMVAQMIHPITIMITITKCEREKSEMRTSSYRERQQV